MLKILRSSVCVSWANRFRGLASLVMFISVFLLSSSPGNGQDSLPANGNRTTAVSGCALSFDGVDDYVSVPNPILTDFTIEYWVKTTQVALDAEGKPLDLNIRQWYNGKGIVDADVPNNTNDFGTSLCGSKLAFGLGNDDYTIFSKSDINTGKWTHVAVTWNQSTGAMEIIINGIPETSGVSKALENRHAPTTITFGSKNTRGPLYGYFEGSLDEVRMWNRVLSVDEIRNNMNGELPSFQQGLLAYYQFNQGLDRSNNAGITTLIDASSSNAHGTLYNFALDGDRSNWVAPGAVVTGNIVNTYSIYFRWWFILIVAGVLMLLVYGVIKLRLRTLRRKNAKLQELISERTAELEVSLGEKTALVNEIHHRVKNNLLMVNAMLTMQQKALKEDSARIPLEETGRRLNAIGLVHEMLYNDDTSGQVSIRDYIEQMVVRMQEMTVSDQTPVEFDVEIEPLTFDINSCVALGMVTSELFSNSMKYAFEGVAEPLITVRLNLDAGREKITYIVRDNGKGLQAGQLSNGIGFRLIDIFIRQLQGTYTSESKNGLIFSFEFPYKKK